MAQSIDAARRRHQGAAGTRVPPHNLQAEESLLGAMLLSRDAIASAIEGHLSSGDFYKPAHGHIYDAVVTLYTEGAPADPVTVSEALTRNGLLEAIGGPATLISLQAGTPAIGNAARYALIIHEHSLLRRLIAAAGDIAEMGYDLPEDVGQVIDQAESLYNQCLDLAPNHVDGHRGLAVLLVESGRPDRAFVFLKKWATDNPAMADARVELSRLHQEFGETKVAERYLDEALAMDPNHYRAWAARGQMREASGDLNQALQNYQQSLAINSLQPDLYQRVASLNVRIAQNTLATGAPAGGWTVQNPQPAAPARY